MKNITKEDRLHAFELMLRLRQAATHPGLVLKAAQTSKRTVCKVLSKILNEAEANTSDDDFVTDFLRPRESTKVRALTKLCKKWSSHGESSLYFLRGHRC